MTDKEQIIIDGVDVSKCKYFEDGECGCEYYLRYGYEITMHDRCEECPNCYFKQLARKTQESSEVHKYYKELRTPATELADKNVKLNKQLKEKEQEYTQLKEDYKELEQRHNEAFQDFERIKQECEELRKTVLTRCPECNSEYLTPIGVELYEQNYHYRKALEEIEEYCIHYLKHNPKSPSIDLNVILDIINKARRK